MKKILFPTDFSKSANNAFDFALALAQEINAEVDVLHVYHLPFIDATNVPAEYIEQMLEEKRQAAEGQLEQFTGSKLSTRIGKRIAAYGIFVPQEIKDLCEEKKYSMVVMGTRGEHHSAMEKLMGSITTHTMMQAPCPVLAIPEDSHWHDVRRIAFATDFQSKDMKAAEQLMSFASSLGAAVHFVHVETKPGIGNMNDQVTLTNYPYKFTDFAVINSPTIPEGLDRYIHEKHIDLLALFIPHRRLWERLFHQSISKRLAFHSKTPLLVFHE